MKLKNGICILLGICLPLLHIGDARAQMRKNPAPVNLKQGALELKANAKQWLETNSKSHALLPTQAILYFEAPPTEQQKEQLLAKGVQLVQHLSGNAYTAFVTTQEGVSALSIAPIYNITTVKPEWKTDANFWAAAQADKVEALISFAKGVSTADIRAELAMANATVIESNLEARNIFKVQLPAGKLRQLANWYGTLYISPLSNEIPLNFESKTATRIYTGARLPKYGGFGLTGQGVTVGVGDNTSGTFNVDLKDRIINYNPATYTNHGVHINGIVGGAAIIDPRGEGMAPHTTLVDHFFSNVWEQTGAMYNTHNMTVTNNSYAAIIGNCNYAGLYDLYSQTIDQIALDYPNVLHVFAAGNDGLLNCSPYPNNFGNVNGGFQPSKNIIVVSSTNKQLLHATDASRGPVKDGRLKPEITSIGAGVTSTTRAEEYLGAGGTSMACPQVAGAAAILTERYRQINGVVDPRADVLKTLLLNGATELGNPGPDYTNGFGFMDVSRSLDMMNNNRYTTDAVSTGDQKSINITVPANVAQLKVMLCWHDVPGNPMATTALVNDLDLEVAEPNATVHLPLVLDATPANVNNIAIEGVDRRNNVEQVTINDPAPGNYIINVKGYNIPTAGQSYVVAYDFAPKEVSLSYPITGAAVKANDSVRIYWYSFADANTFKLEYSTDEGNSWNLVVDNIPADIRFYTWFVPENISSGICRMRISKNGTSFANTTGNFAISKQQVVKLDPIQCPGYMRINWNKVPNATMYKVLRKVGPYMQVVDSTADSTYIHKGLSFDTTYYTTVCPVFDSIDGYRSVAIKRLPDNGSCLGNISDGDLVAEAIVGPNSGRRLTRSALTNNETISLSIRNLDDAPCNYYRISYSVNGAAWQFQDFNFPVIPANGKVTINVPGYDMQAAGSYTIRASVQNLLMPDAVVANDSVKKIVSQLSNDPVNLVTGFTDGFEDIGVVQVIKDTLGFSPNDHWDYANSTDTGQLRSFVNTGISLSGNRSISLDCYKPTTDNQNEVVGTFNLAAYNGTPEEIRLEMNYLLHGPTRYTIGNQVMVRGSDTDQWRIIYAYGSGYERPGVVINTKSLSVNDALVRTGQALTSSFQVKIGQRDSNIIGGRNFGTGMTFDDFKIYTVKNDMQLIRVITPEIKTCGLDNTTPLVVKLYNGVSVAQNNIQLNYRMDDGAVVTEIIPTIGAKDSFDFSFSRKVDLTSAGTHKLDIWLSADGDTYKGNDSIMNYMVRNQPMVARYPYKQDFELNEGGWYAEGRNSSWAFGEPKSPKINRAASGVKAWKTNLTGNYNDDEFSYLYSPCFDLMTLSSPILRFQKAIDIESCGQVLCDIAYMEYSTDGNTWRRLEDSLKNGVNWYNDTLYKVWSEEGKTDWHETSIPLPRSSNLRLRYVISTDPNANHEGLAVDDVEVYDLRLNGPRGLLTLTPNPTADGKLNVQWVAEAGTVMNVRITDLMGREVYTTSATAPESYNNTTIQTPHFMSGMYFVRIEIGNSNYLHKIIYQ